MTYEDVLTNSAALMNDASKSEYTNAAQLPYLNMALSELQEIFELNSIPTTQESSAVIQVIAGQTAVTFAPDTPDVDVDYLPDDLVELNQVWSSTHGHDSWIPVAKRDYLTGNMIPGNVQVSYLTVYAWMGQEIRILAANQSNDLKLDYVRSLFPLIDVDSLGDRLMVVNASSFLNYRTAALCAEFLAENPNRGAALNGNAVTSLQVSLGISVKHKQSIVYRRRPFRSAFKRRGVLA